MAGKTKPGIPVKGINIKLKMINDLMDVTGSAKDSWNPAEISDDMKAISYIHDLADTWNPAQLNEALKYLGFKTVDTWNPAELEETKNKLVKYFLPTDASGNPIELNLKGVLPYEVTALTIDLLPIQDLSHGEPSPTNICPISGRTEVSVKREGKNLFSYDLPIINGYFNGSHQFTGTNEVIPKSSANGWQSVKVKVKGYTQITISGMQAQGGVLCEYTADDTMTPISGYSFNSANKNGTYTVPSNAKWLYLGINNMAGAGSTDYPNAQLELGSTATAYEPYQGETVTVQFEQTVYGGNVNVLEGGTSSTYGYIASYDSEELPGLWISDRDAYAAGTTPTTGAEVVYILTTPETLETPENEIALVNGENTLSTDGDNINITYKANLN